MIKIAIYSGSIPSTIFIEDLINNIASTGIKVYLFGKKNSKARYKGKNIRQFPTPNKKLILLFFVLWNSFRLLITSPRSLFKLNHLVRTSSTAQESKLNKLGVALPMLLHPVDIFHFQWAKSVVILEYLLPFLSSKTILSLRGAHINYSPIADPKLAEDRRFPVTRCS